MWGRRAAAARGRVGPQLLPAGRGPDAHPGGTRGRHKASPPPDLGLQLTEPAAQSRVPGWVWSLWGPGSPSKGPGTLGAKAPRSTGTGSCEAAPLRNLPLPAQATSGLTGAQSWATPCGPKSLVGACASYNQRVVWPSSLPTARQGLRTSAGRHSCRPPGVSSTAQQELWAGTRGTVWAWPTMTSGGHYGHGQD